MVRRSALQVPEPRAKAEPQGVPSSAPARRLSRPRWLDVRMIFGVVLVLVSVLIGARVIAGADKSTSVWALQHDLAAGSTLQENDLKKVRVRLFEDADTYLSTSSSPAGRVLSRGMAAGELLPKSAIGQESSYVTLAISVPAQRVPASLVRGQVINLYASEVATAGSSTAADDQPAVSLVASGLAVADVTGRGQGALTVSSSTLQVAIKVYSCRVEDLIGATEGKTLSIVVLESAPPAGVDDPC